MSITSFSVSMYALSASASSLHPPPPCSHTTWYTTSTYISTAHCMALGQYRTSHSAGVAR
eukprot:1695456-Rhodomonas_salina.2